MYGFLTGLKFLRDQCQCSIFLVCLTRYEDNLLQNVQMSELTVNNVSIWRGNVLLYSHPQHCHYHLDEFLGWLHWF